MRRTRSQYEVWVSKILRSRTIGCLPGCILWICIALVLLSYLAFHLRNPFDFITARLLPSSPSPIVFVARDNLAVFTVLTKANIDIEQNSQNQNAYNSSQVELQRQLYYNRITLRPYSKGEEIQISELGPKVSPSVTYQVREINAMSTFSWMHIGDTLNFLLINTACSAQNATPTVTSSKCLSQASSHILLDVVILQAGTIEEDGTTPLLVAIPSVENKEELPVLDHDIQHTIAYPETTITAVKPVNLYL